MRVEGDGIDVTDWSGQRLAEAGGAVRVGDVPEPYRVVGAADGQDVPVMAERGRVGGMVPSSATVTSEWSVR